MLSQNELGKIREFLEKSQNPLFFFDNDVDGLCSFLILQRAIRRGRGIPIKSFPELNSQYSHKIQEINPDCIFILDKPRVSVDFIKEADERNIPVIWIDHHNVQVSKDILEKVFYFNSLPSSEPTTYLCQKVFNNKEDIWLAMIGCIADVYMPEFAGEFSDKYPELFNPKISAFDSLYTTEIGTIVRILNFGLMDKTTNVVSLMKFLINSKNPYDILNESPKTRQLHYRFRQLNRIYEKLLEKAEKTPKNKKLIFFEYSGQISMSSLIADALYFKNKNKIIIVAYKRSDKINISIRGKSAKKITELTIKNIEGASGGGHEEATGAMIPNDKLNVFKENLSEILEKG